MLQISDLRIRRSIILFNGVTPIKATINEFNLLLESKNHNLTPIELTPEVLDCCQDFKMQYFDGGVIFKVELGLDLKIYFYDYLDKKIRWFLNNEEIINQKYSLHQLQNLYYSLMDKELVIDGEKLKNLYATTSKNQ